MFNFLPIDILKYILTSFVCTRSLYDLKYVCRFLYQLIDLYYVNKLPSTKESLMNAKYLNMSFIKDIGHKMYYGKNPYYLGRSGNIDFIRIILKITSKIPNYTTRTITRGVMEGICRSGNAKTAKWFNRKYKRLVSDNESPLTFTNTMIYKSYCSGNVDMYDFANRRTPVSYMPQNRLRGTAYSGNFDLFKQFYTPGQSIADIKSCTIKALKKNNKNIVDYILDNCEQQYIGVYVRNTIYVHILRYIIQKNRIEDVTYIYNRNPKIVLDEGIRISEEYKMYEIVRYIESLGLN